MKNTLLAVLITTVCYDHMHAQRITPQVIDNTVTRGTVTDGSNSADRLASDILTTNKLVDGVLTSNKLADDILHSQIIPDDVALPQRGQTAPTTLMKNSTMGEQWSYARYVQQQLFPIKIVKKPRPFNSKRTG
ncbi:hypothetical protein [Longitalea luteola]|uniref:hypothetical protein n=1 Tax=Longitalea luteola TaxID=2812563 RepID=UPI001A97958E|nr:hypothetical protein [Longitalea luteola]